MIETAKQQERAILVGVELQETENFDMSMEELASLAKTAGAEVVASYTQKRERYDSKSFVGSGKSRLWWTRMRLLRSLSITV